MQRINPMIVNNIETQDRGKKPSGCGIGAHDGGGGELDEAQGLGGRGEARRSTQTTL